MAAAPQNYQDWVRLHPGVKNAQSLLASWNKYQASRLATQQAAPVPDTPWTPGALDEQGQATENDLSRARNRALGLDGGKGTIAADYEEQAANYNSQLPLIQQRFQDALRSNQNNTSGRGLGNSGITQLYNARSLADQQRSVGDVTSALSRLSDRRTGAELDAGNQYTAGQGQNVAQSNARSLDLYTRARQAAGGVDVGEPQAATPTAAPPTPAAPAAPKVSYAQFAAKAGANWSAAAKQSAYKRLYGG